MKTSLITIATLTGLVTAGCAQSGGDIGIDANAPSVSGLSVRLAADERTSGNQVSNMESIFASIAFVTAHAAGGGWQTISETPVVVDLLRLGDSAAELGFADLPAGRVTQIRLYVADDGLSHAVTLDGDDRPLRVPSGIQSGIKLKGPFDLGECEYGTAVAVVDLEKSIHIHGRGNHDDWQLRPVIKRTDYDAVPGECEPAPEDPEQPGDEPETPVDEPEAPGDEPEAPGDEPEVPGDGGDAGDECAPELNDQGALIDPCTGNPVPVG